MNAAKLVDDLRSEGVRFRLDGDQIRYDAPHGVMTPERIAALRAHKCEVLKLLAAEAATSSGGLVPPSAPAPDPRHAVKRDLLLALAERHDWQPLLLKPGISVGGTARMWHRFVGYADASTLTLAVQAMPHVWTDAPTIIDVAPDVSTTDSGMTVEDVFEHLRGPDVGLFVDDDGLHYLGRPLAADDPLRQALAVHQDELLDLFTYAPGARCVFNDCHRLLAPDDKIACREHRLQMDATPMPWDMEIPPSEVQ